MSTLADDKVELLIAGKTHGDWSSYEIDSDLLTPADAWHVALGMSGGKMPPDVVTGAPVEVKVGGETVLTGSVDEVSHLVSKGNHTFTMSGRDLAADLLDCACPVFTKQQASLSEIVAAIVREFNITRHRIDADKTRTRKKVAVDPGETAWNTLVHAAEANGLWPWFEPDGTLVVGGPDYTTPVVAHLVLRYDGKGNNVLSLDKTESMAERYSKVTVYGQSHGTDLDAGKNDLHASAQDEDVPRYRPRIVIDHEADSIAVCRDRARKLLADSRLQGLTLSATVKGHHIVAPGLESDGELWKPGQRVHVYSEPHNLDAIFFLMARKFTRSRADGTRSLLTLKEDGVWVLDAHPHNRHRRGKNSLLGRPAP
jgi:prophage tail gpP-like protein